MSTKSKIRLNLGQLPIDLTATKDIQDLYQAVHTLHRVLSDLSGNTVYNPEDYSTIPLTNTVHSQGVDRMYVKTLETVAVGDFIKITSTGIVKALFTANTDGSCCHGVVTQVFNGGFAVVARGGIVDGYTGLSVGTDYFLSNTVPGGYQTAPPGSKPCQKVGLGVSPTQMYISIY